MPEPILAEDPTFLNIAVNEIPLRAACFLGVFILLALWEWKAAGRRQKIRRKDRWPGNLGIFCFNFLLIRIFLPGAVLWFSVWAFYHQVGLFYVSGGNPLLLSLLTFVLLDLALYIQHRLYHVLPWFWKFHRVHHSDLEVDVTTGGRFHPVEAALSTLSQGAVILVLGAPLLGVFLYQIFLTAALTFAHSNIRFPAPWEKIKRLLAVTPQMHRIHHSADSREINSNFGFAFSGWDRLLGTYRARPLRSPEKTTLGLSLFRRSLYSRMDYLMLQPFLDKKGNFSLGSFFRRDSF